MAVHIPDSGCSRHDGLKFVFVCKTCDDELICIDCVLDYHKKHDLVKFTEHASNQKHKIHRYTEKLSKSVIPKLDSEILKNDKSWTKTTRELMEMNNDITRHGEQMKNEVDKISDRLVALCKDLEKTNWETKEKNKSALTDFLRGKLRQQDRCQQALTSSDKSTETIEVAKEIRNTEPTTSPTPIARKSVVFEPGTVSNVLLSQMFGKVLVGRDSVSFRQSQPCIVISSFLASFPYDACHTCHSGDEAWLSYWDAEQIYRVDQTGNILEKIECQVNVNSIAISPTTGRVWFSVKEDKSIREVTSDNTVVTRFNVKYVPRTLGITLGELVVAGMGYEGIGLFTSDGEWVKDDAGRICKQKALTPHHMAHCIQTDNIAVSDSNGVKFGNYIAGKEPDKQPRVMVMDKYLKLKFQCSNVEIVDIPPTKFYPDDVCFDSAGDVLVAERVTRSILLIDGTNGDFLRTVFVSPGGEPWCISLRGDNSLWIKIQGGETKIIRYEK